MAEVQWGLANQGLNGFYNALGTGMQMGQDLRMRQDQEAARRAQAEKEAAAQASEARKAQLRQQAAGGDQNALLELYGVDTDTAMKLDDRTKKTAIDGIKYISNAAFQIATLPENQRAAAWDQYVEQGAAQFPGLMQYKGKYSPEALNSIVSQAGEMKEFQTFQQPKYIPYGEGGMQGFQFGQPIAGGNMQSPQQQAPAQTGGGGSDFTFEQYQGAVNGLGAQGAAQWAQKNNHRIRVNTPQEANSLPPGTRYVTPDGQEMIR